MMIPGVAIRTSSGWPPSSFLSYSLTGLSPPWITAGDSSAALTRAGATAWTTSARQGNAGSDRRVVRDAAGAGAGIAATFNTPFGGVLFALEILVPEVSNRTLLPVVVAIGARH
jgi:H+/Cl- antiporter ClcA